MKQKTKILSMLAFGAGCMLANGVATSDTFAIGNPAFTDDKFYSCVVKQYAASYPGENSIATNPADTVLSDSQLAKIKLLNCSNTTGSNIWSYYGEAPSYYEVGNTISSLSGLEKLTGLESLILGRQELTSIDLSRNTELIEILLDLNKFTSIDLSHNPRLKHISITDNEMTAFDGVGLSELESLNLQGNKLTSIDVTNNAKLVNLLLDRGNEGLGIIDLTNNPTLVTLSTIQRQEIIPYVELSQTADCKLAMRIPVVGLYNTIGESEYYWDFDTTTRTLVFKKKPQKGLINSGRIEVKQTAMDGNGVTHIQLLVLPDSVYTAYDDLANCKADAVTPTEISDASTDAEPDIKVPNTGAVTGENNGKKIAISVAAIGAIAALGYLVHYAHNRRKHHIKF